jgi:hypothetical protein
MHLVGLVMDGIRAVQCVKIFKTDINVNGDLVSYKSIPFAFAIKYLAHYPAYPSLSMNSFIVLPSNVGISSSLEI